MQSVNREVNSLGDAAFNHIYKYYEENYKDTCGDLVGKKVVDEKFLVFPGGASVQFTFFFNLFVLMQIANMIASRKIHDEWNIFEGFFVNPVFLLVWGIILVLQVLIIEFSSYIF